MSLQDMFRKLQTRRHRSAKRRNDQHGVEITKRLRELLDTSQPIPPDGNPPRRPNHGDQSDASGDKSRTA
jgi:hypothetical protein